MYVAHLLRSVERNLPSPSKKMKNKTINETFHVSHGVRFPIIINYYNFFFFELSYSRYVTKGLGTAAPQKNKIKISKTTKKNNKSVTEQVRYWSLAPPLIRLKKIVGTKKFGFFSLLQFLMRIFFCILKIENIIVKKRKFSHFCAVSSREYVILRG